jgi:hypothetical protein
MGMLYLGRHPGKLVFDRSFWGTMNYIPVLIMVILLGPLGGPFTMIIALLLPERVNCLYCQKAINAKLTTCRHCDKPVDIALKELPEDIRKQLHVPPFPDAVRVVVARGLYTINMQVAGVLVGTFVIVIAVQLILDNVVLTLVAFLLGFIAAWLCWSYAIPRWREWALSQPGVDPDDLQAAAELALLVWPKGHFFEKTEFRFKPQTKREPPDSPA